MELRLGKPGDEALMSRFYLQNQAHLEPWEPRKDEGFHSKAAWTQRLEDRRQEFAAGRSAHFVSVENDQSAVVATCSLTNIVRGPFQAANMGYSVDKAYEGRGLMKELCVFVIGFAFDELGLNRVMANYMPRNARSAKLLEGLGFEKEGLARRYLCINGSWEDHVLTALVNPNNV